MFRLVKLGLKKDMDNIIAKLGEQEKTKSLACTSEYKGNSFVPSRITLISGKDGVDVFKQTIEIW